MTKLLLGVNIDHVATLRNTRNTNYPDPIQAAFIIEQAGADTITVHLREDRRHITNRDVYILREIIQTQMNLEIAITDEMLNFASKIKPNFCCLVPEKRQEITTESGLDVINQQNKIISAIKLLKDNGINVSLFIDPDQLQIEASVISGAEYIEIHTGKYATASSNYLRNNEFERIRKAVNFANNLNLTVNAGHGLTYYNVKAIASLPQIHELNIGHAIIGRAMIDGLSHAVKEMKKILLEARS